VWTITLVAATIACVMAGIIASRFPVRWDVTADRQYTLTQRTRAILTNLSGPVDVTIVANTRAMNRTVRDQLFDLADTFTTQSSGNVTTTIADVADSSTAQVISRLVARIADRESDQISSHRASIQDAVSRIDDLGSALESLDAPMRRVAAALADPNESARWSVGASALEPLVNDLRTAARELPPFANSSLAGSSIPEPDAAALAVKPVLQRVREGLGAVADQAGELASASNSPSVRDAAGFVAQSARACAEKAASITDALGRLTPTKALEVARVLERAEAVVVVGPSGIVIRPIDALFASGAGASSRFSFTGEEALIGAIGASATALPPILVLVHAEKEAVLTGSGAPTPALAAVCGQTMADIVSRGWKLAEWHTVRTPVMPDRAAMNASDGQPIVWFVLGSPGAATGPDIQRTESLASGIGRLISQGEAVLVTLLPSDLPALGEADPIAEAVAPIGLMPDTGRPLVTKSQTPAGMMFSVDQVVPRADPGSAVGDAIGSMPTMLKLAIPITTQNVAGVRWTPVLTVPGSADTWAEANWRVLGTKRASIEPPTPDPSRDGVGGPWTICGSLERSSGAPGAPAQRIVVVGGALWYADAYTHTTVEVSGRTALMFPGNAHLFQAAIAWLAHQDELIPSATDARDVPRIRALTDDQLNAIRWVLIAGVPSVALICGFLVRLGRSRGGRPTPDSPSR